MANPVAFAANNDPFRGGSFTPGAVPAVNGAIAAAGTGGSLQGAVTAGQPMLARNNRGSNITIPYARVVLHPSAQTALEPAPDAFLSGADSTTTQLYPMGGVKNDKIIETEGLFTGRVAFVLGRRGKNYTNSAITGIASNGGMSVPFRQANQLASFAVGGADVNTMQRMCSFEYLQRYFHAVLKSKVIKVGTAGDFNDFDFPSDYLLLKSKMANNTLTKCDGQALLNDLSNLKYKANSAIANGAGGDKLANSGIFLADDGPFLRGKTLETRLDFVAATSRPRKDLPAAIGDIIAFDRLQQMIAETGACDWVPDGIVHSKLSQGDKVLDDELDSRDGQLFNVTVGGPAITSTWTEDKHMQVLPLDKVFVVIVADVWDGVDEAVVTSHHNAGNYEGALLTRVNRTDGVTNTRRDAGAQTAYLENAASKKAVISNMRVRLMTSSEMVSCSALKDSAKAAWPKGRAAADYAGMARDRHVRLGLKLGGEGGVSEYIIGGWCIGTVLDAAAARSSARGETLVGAIKRQRTSHASNVKVNVEWWSADRMYRSYMNVKGGLATRYNSSKPLAKLITGNGIGSVLAPATKRV